MDIFAFFLNSLNCTFFRVYSPLWILLVRKCTAEASTSYAKVEWHWVWEENNRIHHSFNCQEKSGRSMDWCRLCGARSSIEIYWSGTYGFFSSKFNVRTYILQHWYEMICCAIELFLVINSPLIVWFWLMAVSSDSINECDWAERDLFTSRLRLMFFRSIYYIM